MAPDSDVRLVDEEVHIFGKRSRMKHHGETKIDLHPEGGNITLGGHGSDGDLIFRDGQGENRIHIDASSGHAVGDNLRIYMGGPHAEIALGGDGSPGSVRVDDAHGGDAIFLDGDGSEILVDGRDLVERVTQLESRIEQLEGD